MTKILGINGASRSYGLTYTLLRTALKGAEEEGAEIEIINLIEYDIKPCMGCLCDQQDACRYPCLIEDDMRKLYDKVLEADGIIFSTPIYWFSPSGIMKNFIDRLTALENMIVIEGRSWLEGKVAGIIVVGNDQGAVQAISTLMTTLVSMGFMIPPFAMAYYVGECREPSYDSLMDAYNLGRNVSMLTKLLKDKKIIWYRTLSRREMEALMHEVGEEIKRNRDREWIVRKSIIERFMTKMKSSVSLK